MNAKRSIRTILALGALLWAGYFGYRQVFSPDVSPPAQRPAAQLKDVPCPEREAYPLTSDNAASKSWFDRELLRFQSYPLLDKAYRYLKEENYGAADEEFKQYLDLKPNDLEARLAYSAALYAQKRYQEALDQASIVLGKDVCSAKAFLYAGLCRKALGELEEALANFRAAADLMKEDNADRRLAILSQADILTQLGRPGEALPLFEGMPPSAASEFIKGLTYLALKDYGKAQGAFKSSLDYSGTDQEKMRALRALSETARKEGRYQDAIAWLRQTMPLAGDDPEPFRAIGQLAYAEKDYALAGEMARKALSLSNATDDKKFLANVLVMQKDFEGAAGIVAGLVTEAPDDAAKSALTVKLGDVYAAWGKDQEAVNAYRQAVDYDDTAEALLRLGRGLERLNQDQEALDAFEQAVSKDESPEIKLSLAALYARTGDSARAEEMTRKALDQLPQGPDRLRGLRMLGSLLSAQGDDQAALNMFEQALALSPDDPELLASIGRTDMRLGRYDDAIARFRACLAQKADPEIRLALAEAYDKADKPEDALVTLEAALKDAPTGPGRAAVLERMANLNFRMGRYKDAGGLFLASYEAGSAPDSLVQAGRAYAAAKDYGEAVKAFNRYLALDEPPNGKAEVLHSLGYVQSAQGRYNEAAASFQQALSLGAELPAEKLAAIRIGLAEAYMKTGRAAEAVKVLKAIALGGLPPAGQAPALMTLGQAYAALGDYPASRDAFAKAAGLSGLSGAMRAEIFESLGYAALSCKDLEMAEAAFRQALASGSRRVYRIRYALGNALYQLDRYREALEQIQASLAGEDIPAAKVIMALCWDKLGKPGLAVHFLEQALAAQTALLPNERRLARMTLGYLYANEYRYAEAVSYLREAMRAENDPAAEVRLARLERLSGDPGRALERLLAVSPDSLNEDMRAFRLDELSGDYDLKDDYEQAVTAMEEAIVLAPTAERYFRLGKLHADRKKYDPAIVAFRKAVDLADENRYLTALGYALNDAGKRADAAEAFETVLARDEDYLNLWQDLGYIYMRECENKKAIDRFKKAIDNKPLYPVDNKEQAEQLEKDNYRLRKEVTALSTNLTATAYLTYVAGKAGPPGGAGGEGADVIRSNSGVEVNYIPPVIGFRDNRIFQLVGRINWNLKKDSLEFDPETYQGAFGVRYKPFKEYNLHVGLERLFKIGSQSEENWLFRVLGSWTDGYEVKPGEPWWNYSFAYGEYDYYIDNPSRSMFYGELRQGVTFNYGDRFLVTPHLVADARAWVPDRDHSSFFEGGVGLSLKYLFNEPAYEVYRSYFELLMHYKLGLLYNRTAKDGDQDINALFITGILHF